MHLKWKPGKKAGRNAKLNKHLKYAFALKYKQIVKHYMMELLICAIVQPQEPERQFSVATNVFNDQHFLKRCNSLKKEFLNNFTTHYLWNEGQFLLTLLKNVNNSDGTFQTWIQREYLTLKSNN